MIHFWSKHMQISALIWLVPNVLPFFFPTPLQLISHHGVISLLATVLLPSLLGLPPSLTSCTHSHYVGFVISPLISLVTSWTVVLCKLASHPNVNWPTALWLSEKICTLLISSPLVLHLTIYWRAIFIPTNSHRSKDPLLLTGCFSITGSLEAGGNTHAPAPQGPGL